MERTLLCFLVYLQFGLGYDGDTCNCINLDTCQSLKYSQSNPYVTKKLQQAHCGFDGNNPKVCCPSQGLSKTPVPSSPSKTITNSGDFVTLPEPPVCGTSNTTTDRVVNGQNVRLGALPWMAVLRYKIKSTLIWRGGGSLVSSRHVLTAAHCIYNLTDQLYQVRLGELDLERDDEGATPLDVLIKDMIIHEAYNPNSSINDIGILVLDKTVQFTELIKPICIPRPNSMRSMTFTGHHPIVAGWGDTKFMGTPASHLQALQLPVLKNADCAKAYIKSRKYKINERMLCAGYLNGGKDTCKGDSGGPLMQPIQNQMDLTTPMYQIGVISFGKKCAEPGFPGVYTRVTHFVPWIEEKIIGPSSRYHQN